MLLPTPVTTPRRGHRAGRARVYPNARMAPDTCGPWTHVQTACHARAAGHVQARGWGRRPVGSPWARGGWSRPAAGGPCAARGLAGWLGHWRTAASAPRSAQRPPGVQATGTSWWGLAAGNPQAESRGAAHRGR